MALALYRRYRPDTFDGVIGQDQVVVPLCRALDEGKLTHAYLFSGPRGCGKTSSARILARCINCEKGPTSHPCGKCESCKDLSANGPGSIDVVEIDAASHNGVDDARELRERAGFAPARDRYKIFILDEAHMVTQQGFNALLKIVEEPPEHVMFIFATTEPEKVISTIRSRTHHYPFRLVPPEIMGPYLEKICAKEKISTEPGVLKLAMRAGGGSVRDTLSVLDQLMVGSQKGIITYESATALLGFTPDALISDAIDAVINKDGSSLYSTVEKVVVGGFEPRRFVEDLLARVRDLLVLTLAGKQAVQVFSDETQSEDTSVLERQAKALGLAKLTTIADKINDTLATMSGATSPRMRLELMAAQLLEVMEEPKNTIAVNPATGAAPQQAQQRGGFNPPKRAQARAAAPAPVAAPARTGTAASAPTATPAPAATQAPSNTAPQQSAPPQTGKPSASTPTAAPVPAKVATPNAEPSKEPAAAAQANGQEPEKQHEPAAPMSDMEMWASVLKSMPHDLSEYVEPSKVPVVEFSTNAMGGKHLVFTFDKPLSQHAFALAVSGQKGVPGQVQNAVRKVFGKNASIAPNNVAANGEAVQTVQSMSPQQQAAVKRDIALSAMKTAGGSHTGGAEEHREAKTESKDGSDGESADAHHAAAAPIDVPPEDDDPWADEPDSGFAQPQESGQGSSSMGSQPAQASAAKLEHVHKSVPVPSSDDDDPWADEPDTEPDAGPDTAPVTEPGTEPDAEPGNGPEAGPQNESSRPDEPNQQQVQPVQAQSASQSQNQSENKSAPRKPAVSADEDTYSINDASLGASDVVDLETLEKILDVKKVNEITPPDKK